MLYTVKVEKPNEVLFGSIATIDSLFVLVLLNIHVDKNGSCSMTRDHPKYQ